MPIKETAAKKDVHKKEEQEVISELKKMEISKPEDDAENAIRRATKKPLSQEQQKQQVMMRMDEWLDDRIAEDLDVVDPSLVSREDGRRALETAISITRQIQERK